MEAAGLIKEVAKPRVLSFKFEDVTRLPPPIIAFSDVAFAYSGKKVDYLYKDLSFGIDMDSRIAIVGDNGSVRCPPTVLGVLSPLADWLLFASLRRTGKSTLLNMITGELSPTEGTISKHSALKLAKYSQHSADQLPYNKSPLEHFESLFHAKFPDKDLQVRSQTSSLPALHLPQTLTMPPPSRPCSSGDRSSVDSVFREPTKRRPSPSSRTVSETESSSPSSPWNTRP